MRLLWFIALLAPPILASGAAAAAQSGPDAGEPIVVTGSRGRAEAIRDYVAAVTVETHDQLARFATPVCPASFGLPAGHNEVIIARLRQIADHLGAGSAGPAAGPMSSS